MAAEPLTLDENNDPLTVFADWLNDAEGAEVNDPSAMALATVDADGLPNVRMVLLKGFDERGFAFYTNFESVKGRELLSAHKAALCFHWKSLRRQVRVRGPVDVVTVEEADSYYESRPRESRVGAWASDQSRPLSSRALLEQRVEEVRARFGEGGIARPEHWSGFRVKPVEIEFWQDGAFRLHDRFRFTREGEGVPWQVNRLFP